MLSHGQKRNQLPKIDRAFSILGLWHRGLGAGGSLRPFRLPHFVTVLDVRAIAECRVSDVVAIHAWGLFGVQLRSATTLGVDHTALFDLFWDNFTTALAGDFLKAGGRRDTLALKSSP